MYRTVYVCDYPFWSLILNLKLFSRYFTLFPVAKKTHVHKFLTHKASYMYLNNEKVLKM